MVERKTLNLVVVGSSPTEGAFFFQRRVFVSLFTVLFVFTRQPTQQIGWPSGLRRQFKALVSSEARVRISSQSYVFITHNGRLAQLVEHWSNKPRVAGSSPVLTTVFFLNTHSV